MKKQDGGPAFPRPIGTNGINNFEEREVSSEQEGMSLRDYFAVGMVRCLPLDVVDRLVNPEGDRPLFDEVGDDNQFVVPVTEMADRIAKASYVLADAMLRAREVE